MGAIYKCPSTTLLMDSMRPSTGGRLRLGRMATAMPTPDTTTSGLLVILTNEPTRMANNNEVATACVPYGTTKIRFITYKVCDKYK